jgi:hypothetical protein
MIPPRQSSVVILTPECNSTGGCFRVTCPHCSTSFPAETIEQQTEKLRREVEELNRLCLEFADEIKKARAERETGSVFKRPERHWGGWRRQQPRWARGPAFVRTTRRPRR